MKKILFINFGGLGDEILFLPTINSIKREYPDSEITLTLEPRSLGVLSLTNIVDDTLCANIKGKHKYLELLKLLLQIWTKKFDMVISSGSNKFISVFLFMTFIKKRFGYDTGNLSKKLLTKAIPLNKNQYAVSMYHDLVSEITNYKTELPIIDVERKTQKENTILIHPGVSLVSVNKNMIKTIPAETWAEVIVKLSEKGKEVVLVGGPDDKECIEKIMNIVPSNLFTNMYGKTRNLRELASLISEHEIFLCSDSAPLHVAIAMGVKTYVIFGSTDDKKLIPQSDNVIAIKNNYECPLRPCLWERRQTTCEELGCLKISSDEICNAIIK